MNYFKSGTIKNIEGENSAQIGWRVEICEEENGKGCYLYLFPIDKKNEGFDYWFPDTDDALHQLKYEKILVEWK